MTRKRAGKQAGTGDGRGGGCCCCSCTSAEFRLCSVEEKSVSQCGRKRREENRRSQSADRSEASAPIRGRHATETADCSLALALVSALASRSESAIAVRESVQAREGEQKRKGKTEQRTEQKVHWLLAG